MKFDNFPPKEINKITIYVIVAVGILIQLLYLFQFNDYFDDWNFFYTVNPNISNSETWQRHYFGDRGDGTLREAFPWNFTYFTKYALKLVGYSIESTHYFLLLFSLFSYFLFYKVVALISKDFKFIILVFILFATNLFLIRELNSFRPHSVTIFLSLLSNYFFILIFIKNNNKKKYFFIYIISTLMMLSFWPHALALFCGHCIFLLISFIKKKTNYLFYFLAPLIVIILYILLNYKYIQYVALDNSWSYTAFDYTFFINFFFRTFFGSIIFGGLMLLIFTTYLIKEITVNLYHCQKNNFLTMPFLNIDIKNFILINILTIYTMTIIYSIVRESVMAPKYFLMLIPLIIIWLSIKISENKKKYIYNLVIIFTILNSFYYWNDLPIDRPPAREVLKIVNYEKIKTIYTTENIVFNNYLSHYNYAIKNKIKVERLKDLEKINIENKFAIVCLNYPRYAVGDTFAGLEDPDCKNVEQNNNLHILKLIKIPDFFIFIAEYKL